MKNYFGKRFFRILLVLILCVSMMPAAVTAEEFDTENFVGLVLTNTADNITVTLYQGFSTSASNKMTPVHTETTADGTNYYYTVTANSKYTCIAKPTTGYARYNNHYSIYITEEEAQVKTVMDVTPQVRITTGWDPSTEIRHYTDETLTNIYPSDASKWPQYAEAFLTPAFGKRPTEHKQTTQDEMEAFIADLDGTDDNMYVYILGQSAGTAFDIPLVIFTETDLSGAKTLEEAAALVNANNKLTVHYQAQIHGNEPAAGEAALGMIKRIDGEYGENLLDSMNIYIIPRLNPYGAYKSQRQVYLTSSSTTDPNRDFLRLWTKETQLRMAAYNLFDPEVVLDGHEFQVAETSTKLQKRDMMLCSHFLPTFTQEYQEVALDLAFSAFDQMKADGLGYSWYTDSVNGIGANTGSSNTAFRASMHILMETDGIYRGLQNYERRVAAHHSAMTGIFAYLDANADAVQSVVQAQRETIVENGKTYEEEDFLILDGSSSDHEELHITGQWINVDSGTVLYNNSSFDAAVSDVIKRSRVAPTAYVMPANAPNMAKILSLMDKQGISYDFIPAGSNIALQQYTVVTTREDGTTAEAGLTDEQVFSFPEGAYAFTMDQVDALILATLMEPDVNDTYNSDLGKYMGTLAHDGVITATDGKFPLYRYIRDLNANGQIDTIALAASPEGLETVSATEIGGTGKITGLDASKSYEYRAEDTAEYTAVETGATEITNLPVGKYYVRFAETATSFASADASCTVSYALSDYIVYVDQASGDDTDDGYTNTTAVQTFAQAHKQLAALLAYAPADTTGTIHIIGTYGFVGSQQMPKHSYPILITGGTFKFTKSDSNTSTPYWLGIGGDTTFNNVTLTIGTNSSSYFLYGEGYKLVIGENVTSLPYGTGSNYFNIAGGGHSGNSVTKTDVTVKSGRWLTLYAGGYTGKVNTDARLVAENCSVSRVTNSYNSSTTGNVYYDLKNVTVRTELYCGNTNRGNVGGDVTLVLGEGVTSPKIYAGSRDAGNVGGTVTIVADGIDLSTYKINGKANNATGTIGGLKLVLNQGKLSQVMDSFVTRDGVEIVLGCDQAEAVTIPYSCNLDLNGCDASNITIADGKTLTVKDSATDDYTIEDAQGYGILSATGNYVAAEGYETVEETDGYSYHKKELALTKVAVRASQAGIYYVGQFGMDEILREDVLSYGVVLSLNPNPTLNKEGCLYTRFTSWDDTTAGNGTLLSGILKPTNTYSVNRRNAEMTVYGIAYLETADGIIYSNEAGFSLRQVIEGVDARWSDLTQGQRENLLGFYDTYQSVMENWNIPNTKEHA